MDDQTVAYVMTAQKHFEDLKQVAAQLAGFLVLAESGSRTAVPDHPMFTSARELSCSARDGIRGARVTPRTRAHHAHLVNAAAMLDGAFSSADPLQLLQSAYSELRAASKALPGFEMISFACGCCA
jgi:hypothetical protein